MNQYDTVIIGAGQSDLTLPFGHPSPKGEGNARLANKKPLFSQRLGVIDYAGTAMYSAEAVLSGIGSLSSSNP
jgi:hypothetical protein